MSSPRLSFKKNTREFRVLEFLEKTAFVVLDLSLPKKYSYSALWRGIWGLDNFELKSSDKDWQQCKRMFSATLSRLKNKGLVQKENKTRGSIWKLNQSGRDMLLSFQARDVPEDGVSRLFIFDIPEKSRHYRQWIRLELILGGYQMLQKSVWFGKRPLSEAFLRELLNKDLFEYIQFFEVKKEGTLENLKMENV